jgi:broad specificity polyphosphatase/5'/3'-nucleotidase SurE
MVPHDEKSHCAHTVGFSPPFVTTKMKEVFVAQQEIQKVPGTHDSSAASASLIIF